MEATLIYLRFDESNDEYIIRATKFMQKYVVVVRVQCSANQLCMATTDAGRVGMFPPLVQRGDLICVLKELNMPVLLPKRHDDGSGYEFVGASYVHTVSESEVAEMVSNGDRRWRRFSFGKLYSEIKWVVFI
jgi:hypothetical protein